MTLPSIATLFLRIGNLTFGGGDAITALLQRELVHRKGWLTLDQFGLAQSLARVTPGTGILAFSAATAWMLRRWAGAVSAVLAVSVPSAVLVVLLTWGFTSLSGSARALATLAAILAAAVGHDVGSGLAARQASAPVGDEAPNSRIGCERVRGAV